MEQGDIEEGMRAAEAIGDDTLQKQIAGRASSPTASPTARRRSGWRRCGRGYKSGDPAACKSL